jgi:hypothetical protein
MKISSSSPTLFKRIKAKISKLLDTPLGCLALVAVLYIGWMVLIFLNYAYLNYQVAHGHYGSKATKAK